LPVNNHTFDNWHFQNAMLLKYLNSMKNLAFLVGSLSFPLKIFAPPPK